MPHITEIHEEIYKFLTEIISETDPNLRFTLRRSNRDGRLEDGYWFYGNEDSMAVSFWSGNDWRNRTPNIIFVVIPSGETFLEISTSDSKIKRMFVEKHIVPQIQSLEPNGKKYSKQYPGNSYLASLKAFLAEDKRTIDSIVEEKQDFFEDAPIDERIFFIDSNDFQKTKVKVEQYRSNIREETFQEANKSIKSIQITGYGPIKQIDIINIPENTQWIFLTGENGTGKTNILKGIAVGLTNKLLTHVEVKTHADFSFKAQVYTNRGAIQEIERKLNRGAIERKLWINGFAAYGPSRLLTNHSGLSAAELNRYRRKTGITYSLFNNDGVLLDLLYKYQRWTTEKKHSRNLDERLKNIREVLYDIIPSLHQVIFDEFNGFPITKYIEEDDRGEPFTNPVTFEKLASGIRSTVAMFSDMMCRLFDQQPEKADPAELTGIVLIDEIDIHLHPKLQKKMVQELSRTFKKIQFVATTHSPIPLLGAPKNSKIFHIQRTSNEGVVAKSMDYIDFSNLLPNTLLTSPIFGLEEIKPVSNANLDDLNVDDSLQDTKFFEIIDKKLEEIEKMQNLENNKYFDEV